MTSVQLKGYKVDSINFVNNLENGTQIQIGQSYKYNVQYNKEQNLCRGQFEIDVHDNKQPDRFKICATVVGIFQFDPNKKRETVHADSFKTLFPYVKALVTTITANCGIPPIIIPEIDIDSQEIVRFDGKQ